MPRHTFKKNERLTGKKTFDLLFTSGQSISVFPFRLVWMQNTRHSTTPLQLGISVPKRLFDRAVDRNKIKRRMREAYRKNKQLVYEVPKKKHPSIALMMIYTAKDVLSYQEIEKKMIVSLQKLAPLVAGK